MVPSTPVIEHPPYRDRQEELPELEVIGGCRILGRIASGATSEVYLGLDLTTGENVAIKVLSHHLARIATHRLRFEREGEIGIRFQHPNLVHYHRSGYEQQRYFIIMEYVPQQSVQDHLDRQGSMALGAATSIILNVARGLEVLHHQKLIHRDVKPGNILLTDDQSAKLGDFGVSRDISNAEGLTAFDQLVGTPYYMPWEQSLNSWVVDERSDLFALGATYYQMVVGALPFPGETIEEVHQRKMDGDFLLPSHLVPGIPRDFDRIIIKLLSRNPAERYSSAAHLIDVLQLSGLQQSLFWEQATDLNSESPTVAITALAADAGAILPNPRKKPELVWYVQYRDSANQPQSIRATKSEMRQKCLAGELPSYFEVSKQPDGPFQKIRFGQNRFIPQSAIPNSYLPKQQFSRILLETILWLFIAIIFTVFAASTLHYIWELR
ncbi:MAG: serine/threonine-protein kinase [Zavarzinella sp.]